MSAENKALARRWLEEGFNEGNLNVADEIFADDYINHDALPGQGPGPEGTKHNVSMLRSAFPDLHCAVEYQVAEGDKVVTRFSLSGTHQGELLGIPPTSNRVSVTGILVFRIAEGKAVEGWLNWDMLGLMRQLGVVPPPGQGAGVASG